MPATQPAQVGVPAPAFTLPDQRGRPVSLADLAGRWVVLYAYPKDDTPGCTVEATEFTALLDEFARHDAVVLGISPDDTRSHAAFCDRHDLGVTLLSDPDHEVLERYGAWGTKMLYGRERTGVLRSTVLVDPDGTIAHAWPNVRAKGHARRVLDRLAALRDQ